MNPDAFSYQNTGKGLVESEEEEFLEEEEEEQPEFVSEEMGDRNDPLGGSKHGLFGGSRGDILNDLARGQQQLVDLMTQLLLNSHGRNNNDAECSNGRNGNRAEGSNTNIPPPPNTRVKSKTTTRPTLPQCLTDQPVVQPGQPIPGDSFTDYLAEYKVLGTEFHTNMSFQELWNIKYRNKPRDFGQMQQNFDLQWKMGKLNIPSFDGSNKCTMRAWVQKIDAYFQLNPMREIEAIKDATLHLEGEAHEWWYHGLNTLGHASITSYLEFTQILISQFDKKDP